MVEVFGSIAEAGAWLSDALAEDLQGWLTTVDPDGTPHPTTVWFYRDGESIVVYSEPGKPKLRNIAANPRVSFHLNSDRYGERWAVMTGKAELLFSPTPLDAVPAYMQKYAEAFGHWDLDVPAITDAYDVAIRFTPSRVRLRIR